MAAKKRKPIRSAAKKGMKKPASRMQKKSSMKAKGSKMGGSSAKSSPSLKLVRSNPATNIGNKPYTKGQLFTALADCSGLPRKVVAGVFEDLHTIIAAHLKKGPGQFTLPGLVKVKLVHKPATKARDGVNPFTGEKMRIKAKPARNVVRVRPLKALKEVV